MELYIDDLEISYYTKNILHELGLTMGSGPGYVSGP